MIGLDVEAVLRARERASQRVRNRVAMEGPDRCACNMCPLPRIPGRWCANRSSRYGTAQRHPGRGRRRPTVSEHTAEKDVRLRAVAEAADNGGRPWEWHGGYPQQVVRVGDAMLVAETYEGPDFPSTIAEFIATFDPPTVLALLDALRAARRTARDAVAAKEARTTPRVTSE